MKKVSSTKFFQKIKSYYKSLTINSYRFWLTIVGIAIGVIILIVGIICLDSYKNSYYDKFDSFKDDLIYINNRNTLDSETIKYFDANNKNSLITYYTSSRNSQMDNDCPFRYDICGVSSNFLSNYVIDCNADYTDDVPIVYEPEWFKGKEFTSEDYALKSNKVIINHFTAQVLFGDESPIDKYVNVNHIRLKIIGVVADSQNLKDKLVHYNKTLKSKGKDFDQDELRSLYPYMQMFMPITSYKKIMNPEITITQALMKVNNVDNKKQVLSNLNHYYSDYEGTYDIFITDRDMILKNIDKNIREVKIVLYAIVGFIMLISGFTMMNTLFYSIKEKIPEIGIRRAFGATGKDIMFQTMFEGLFYLVISFIFGLLISLIIIVIALILITEFTLISFSLKISVLNLVFIFLLMLLEGIIFSIFPAFYANNMKIVDAVKFE